MSEIEILIRREIQWMAQGNLDDADLASIVIAKSRSRRIRRIVAICLFALVVSAASILGYIGLSNVVNSRQASNAVLSSSLDSSTKPTVLSENNSSPSAQISEIISDYPVKWEQSIGDLGAISKAANIGDTLGGLTAQKLIVEWSLCHVGNCPTTWTLQVMNKTEDIISVAPSLMVYIDNAPLINSSRPLTLIPNAKANLVFSFPELVDITNVNNKASWQWNWFLTVAR